MAAMREICCAYRPDRTSRPDYATWGATDDMALAPFFLPTGLISIRRFYTKPACGR